MAGIEAVAEGQIRLAGREIANEAEFFEAAAHLTAGSDGIFEEDSEVVGFESGGCFGETEDKRGESFFESLAFEITGVENEIFGSEQGCAVKFGAE